MLGEFVEYICESISLCKLLYVWIQNIRGFCLEWLFTAGSNSLLYKEIPRFLLAIGELNLFI